MTSSPPIENSVLAGFTFGFSFLVLTDLIGNTLVILIMLTDKSMKSPMNYLLVNLAVADMVVAVFLTPRLIFHFFFVQPEGLKGNVICKIISGGTIGWIGAAASVFSLVSICFDRYFAVVHPYSPKLKLTFQKVKHVVITCWIFSTIITLPSIIVMNYNQEKKYCWQEWPVNAMWLSKAYSFLLVLFVHGLIPIAIMSCLYGRVIYILWFKRSENRAQGTQLAMLKSRKRVTKVMIIVSVLYCVTWIPSCITFALLHVEFNNVTEDQQLLISSFLVVFNSTVNPFVYALQSQKFRLHLKELISSKNISKKQVEPRIDGHTLQEMPSSNKLKEQVAPQQTIE